MALPEATRSVGGRLPARGAAVLVLLWAVLAGARAVGPWDLTDNDQARPALYALDVLVHGSWLVQVDTNGAIASKPPVYTWLVAAASLLAGGFSRLALYGPTAAAVLGTALLAAWAGARRWGATCGVLAGVMFLASSYGYKHVALARTDAVFACLVTAAAVLAWRAAERPGAGRWAAFWAVCAAVTLTKGPIGVVLAAGGLLGDALLGRGATERLRAGRAGQHALGVLIFLVVTGAWFYLAWRSAGQPFIDKVIGRELVGHAVRSDGGALPLSGFYKPALYYLGRFAPWSVLTVLALVRVVRRPDDDAGRARAERFAAGWFLTGLAIFSIAPHQRADLLLPIVPAGALLAARELERMLGGRSWGGAWAIAVLGGAAALGHGLVMAPRGDEARRTALLMEVASGTSGEMRARLVDVDTDMAFQALLGTHVRRVDAQEAGRRLASGPVVVATRSAEAVMEAARAAGMTAEPRVLVRAADPVRRGRDLVVLLTSDPALGEIAVEGAAGRGR
ncbi:MAG: glycosyltransferase family 39 protein [Planctomycetota bacterium]|nr:glycosyltransferase family 39 protein [Planctomycetota bacterium]